MIMMASGSAAELSLGPDGEALLRAFSKRSFDAAGHSHFDHRL